MHLPGFYQKTKLMHSKLSPARRVQKDNCATVVCGTLTPPKKELYKVPPKVNRIKYICTLKQKQSQWANSVHSTIPYKQVTSSSPAFSPN